MALSKNFVAFFLLAFAVLSRLIPFLPNFSPILAISLFAGVYFSNRWVAFLLPVAIMLVSDLFIGFHELVPVVYGLFVLFAFVGTYLKERLNVISLAATGLIGSFTFFMVTNFFLWLTSGMYPLDGSGLITCYLAAIPFFHYSLLGDAVYIPLLFGSFYLLEKAGFVLSEQTA